MNAAAIGKRNKVIPHSVVVVTPFSNQNSRETALLCRLLTFSVTLFNIFLERIMTDASEDHEGTVSIGGRTNLRFADDIDGLAGEEEELTKLVECLDKASTAYGMEISAEKTKLVTNNTSDINTEITVNGQKLETVTSFK